MPPTRAEHSAAPGLLERHRAVTVVVSVLLLVGVGILAGEVVGRLLVELVELVLDRSPGPG